MPQRQVGRRRPAKPGTSDKKQEILEVAARHFLAHGYEGASISAMARQSRISKESIYRYFPTKSDLFKAVIDREIADYRQRLRQAHLDNERLSLREALIATAVIMLGNLLTDRALALNRLIVQETILSRSVGRHFYSTGPKQTVGRIEKLFHLHRRETNFDPKTLCTDFRAMVLHAISLDRRCGIRGELSKAQIRNSARTTVDRFLKAFFPAGTR